MMNIFWLLLAYQDGGVPPVWEEIARLEAGLRQSVQESRTGFTVSNNDPVNGYYIDHVGVVMLIPLRYSASNSTLVRHQEVRERLSDESSKPSLDRAEVQKRYQAWVNELERNASLKDANFEQVVSRLRAMIPSLIGGLEHLPQDETLVLVIEERAPAWFYAGFRKDATRKVVTLTVDKDLMSIIHAKETVMEEEWLRQVKRTTTTRKVITGLLSGSSVVTD